MCLKRALYFGPFRIHPTPTPLPAFEPLERKEERKEPRVGEGGRPSPVRGAVVRAPGPRPFPALFGWPGLRCSLARQRDKPICQWGGGFWKLLSPPPHRGP